MIEGGARLIRSAAKSLDLGPEGSTAPVVDYGAGTGATSVRAVGTALRSIRDRDRDRPVLAIHNDVLGNDFGQLFRNIAAPDGYLEIAGGPIYPAAVAGSFFDRVLPARAVRLGMCSNAAHWLRRQPSVRIGDGMYFCEAVGDARETLARRAADDWLSFLRARADELAPGGRLLVQGIGSTATGGDEQVSASRLLRVMWEAAAGLADDGLLDRARLDDYVFPVYCRSPGELTAPIADRGPLAGRLTLLTQEVDEVPSPYWEAFERDPDAEAYASAYVEFVRAFAEPTLRAHLFEPAATGTSAAALSDEYFRRLERATAADPAAGRYEAWIVRTVFERPPGA